MIEPGMRMPPADRDLPVNDKYIEAVNLNAQIHISAQAAQQNLYDMCMGLKKMRDSKLYKELGYTEFNNYCTKEIGISDRQVYKYISIAEKVPENLVNSGSLIGVKKLYLISTLSDDERTELTETTDLENISVRELEQQIRQLKSEQSILQNERDEAMKQNAAASHQVFMADKKVLEMKNKISDLENQIKDLESRPIEVAVETDSKEVANLKDAMKRVDLDWSEKYSQLEEQNIKDRRELLQKIDNAEKEKDKLSAEKEEKLSALKTELEKTKAEYEKKLSEKPEETAVKDDKETFKAYLSNALDSAKRLCEFVRKNAGSDNYKLFCDKSKQLADLIKSELEE